MLGKNLFGVFVSHLHVVDAGRDIGLIDRLDEPVFEAVIVDQTAIANGAVQDFKLGAIREPRSGQGRLLFANGLIGARRNDVRVFSFHPLTR